MDDTKFTLEEAHKEFAVKANGEVWALLDKPDRTHQEDLLLIEAAYTSLYHWRAAGTPVHVQRGEWLLAHIFTGLKMPQLALAHAEICYELTESASEKMADFDLAYGNEGMARALAVNGLLEEARPYLERAARFGAAIADAEDKSIFMNDFQGGDWFGLTTT